MAVNALVRLTKGNVNAVHSTDLGCLDRQLRHRPLIPNKVPQPINHVTSAFA